MYSERTRFLLKSYFEVMAMFYGYNFNLPVNTAFTDGLYMGERVFDLLYDFDLTVDQVITLTSTNGMKVSYRPGEGFNIEVVFTNDRTGRYLYSELDKTDLIIHMSIRCDYSIYKDLISFESYVVNNNNNNILKQSSTFEYICYHISPIYNVYTYETLDNCLDLCVGLARVRGELPSKLQRLLEEEANETC